MNILLAIDGSTCSDVAVNEVATRPWPKGSAVKVIMSVKLPFVPTEETRSLPDSYYSQMEKAYMEHANSSIAKALTSLGARSLEPLGIESEVILGDAREVILDVATRWNADLIVLGSRGLSGFKRFLLGSVALGALTYAPCSVRIVRGSETQDTEAAMKILLAVDTSPCSDAAAYEVAQRPWPVGSKLKIVHASEISPGLPQNVNSLPDSVRAHMQSAASEAIDQAKAHFIDSPLEIESEILHGSPKIAILDEAGKWGADLIVVGSRGLNAVDRFLLGSVSHAVAMRAKCSVEVVRRTSP